MKVTNPNLGHGRLGNQIWQVFSTIGVAKMYGLKVQLTKWKYAEYFKIPNNIFFDNVVGGVPARNLARWIRPDRVDLHDLRCFGKDYGWVKSYLKPSDLALEKISKNIERYNPQNCTAVSVRRGDYHRAYDGKNLINEEYYIKNWPSGDVLVFTDDPSWCRRLFPNYEIIHDTDWMDLHLMRMCKAHVISNSSFAWWGAFGSDDVTYPDPWIIDVPDLNIFLDHWKAVSRY